MKKKKVVLTREEQLELGKSLFHDILGVEKWEDLDGDTRQSLIKLVVENFQSAVPDAEREVEFCYTIDTNKKVQLMAVPKPHFDSISKSQTSNA